MRVQSCGLAVALALSVAGGSADAQRVEKGSREDLANVRAIYVDAGSDSESRSKLLAALAKELPTVRVVGSEAEAQVVLRYSISSTQTRSRPEVVTEAAPKQRPVPIGQPRQPGRRVSRPMPEQEAMGHVPSQDSTHNPFGLDDDYSKEEESPIKTFVTGEALRVTGEKTYRKAFEFVRRVDGRSRLLAVDDFVRAFAKQYRKVNSAETPGS